MGPGGRLGIYLRAGELASVAGGARQICAERPFGLVGPNHRFLPVVAEDTAAVSRPVWRNTELAGTGRNWREAAVIGRSDTVSFRISRGEKRT
jgi:hypothetical protein